MSSPLEQWVDQVARHTRPDNVFWCDGSESEYERLVREMLEHRTLFELNQREYPGCFLHRSDPNDVARTEHLTFVCSREKVDAGPNNNWMAPAAARDKVGRLFAGSMKGRTMYVVPYVMGPADSSFSQVGVEITDSPYVAVSMRIMTRMGSVASERLGSSDYFVKGLHSLGDLSPDRRLSSISRRSGRSGRSARATAATRCSGRSATRSASRAGWHATRAGSPSTC